MKIQLRTYLKWISYSINVAKNQYKKDLSFLIPSNLIKVSWHNVHKKVNLQL